MSPPLPKLAYSPSSRAALDTAHPDLQYVHARLLQLGFDHTVIQGRRSKADQDAAFKAGKSKVSWPDSKHNVALVSAVLPKEEWAEDWGQPSRAVDSAPYVSGGIPWPDSKVGATLNVAQREYVKRMALFYMHVGRLQAVAATCGVKVRFGADWDGDGEIRDQHFDDLPHVELAG